jgi:hypothetical protein
VKFYETGFALHITLAKTYQIQIPSTTVSVDSFIELVKRSDSPFSIEH